MVDLPPRAPGEVFRFSMFPLYTWQSREQNADALYAGIHEFWMKVNAPMKDVEINARVYGELVPC